MIGLDDETGEDHCYNCGRRIGLLNARRQGWCEECEGEEDA